MAPSHFDLRLRQAMQAVLMHLRLGLEAPVLRREDFFLVPGAELGPAPPPALVDEAGSGVMVGCRDDDEDGPALASMVASYTHSAQLVEPILAWLPGPWLGTQSDRCETRFLRG